VWSEGRSALLVEEKESQHFRLPIDDGIFHCASIEIKHHKVAHEPIKVGIGPDLFLSKISQQEFTMFPMDARIAPGSKL
jgi:hypothetical protein